MDEINLHDLTTCYCGNVFDWYQAIPFEKPGFTICPCCKREYELPKQTPKKDK